MLRAALVATLAVGLFGCTEAREPRAGPTAATRTEMGIQEPLPGECRVTRVADGDTIEVSGCPEAGLVRLLLVDTPELQDCFGPEAKTYVSAALEGKNVKLERDVTERDAYGRLLRYAWIGGELFNERMARDGMARLLVYDDVRYRERIAAGVKHAQESRLGLWGADCGYKQCAGPVQIVALDKRAEVVTIEGAGDLTGWEIVSERGAGTQRFRFQPGFVLAGVARVWSGVPPFPPTDSDLWWTSETIWSNSEDDDALLVDQHRRIACEFDDGI